MKELTKKIICLLLIIIMTGGSLFTPIICFAEELRTEEKQEIKKLGSTPNLPNNEIKPVTKEEIVKKTKNDNYEINTLSIDFVSGAVKDGYGNLVWTPENSAYGHEFTFRVNYAISGLKELPANSVKITIPKSIIRNRDGKLDDSYLMSLPSDKEYDGTTNLAYTESGDYIVVYNPEEIEAGSNGYFEVSYSTNSETFYYRDYDSTKTDTIANGGTASDPFYATIQLKTDYDTLGQVSEEKNVFIDTHAKIVSTQKRYPTIYRSWDSSWMKDAPADSDEYYYLVWEIRTNIENNPTQNYNFSLQDVVEDLTSGTTGEDYEFVGYKMAGEKYYSNKNTQKDIHGSSYRYDYVLTRHKISTYRDIEYTLKNTITANVDPIDQVDEDTNATSSNKFSWDPGFVVPTGHFDLFKYGNNNWVDKFGYFWDYANYELDKFQKDEIDELKGFKYYTETIGYAYPWTLKEGGSQDNPEDYGYNFVNYDTWDDTLYLENETVPLSYNDYYLEFLTYSIENKGAQFDEFENKFKQVSPTYDDNETIIFYGKFNGGQEWIEIGKYNIKNKKVTLNDQYVKNMTTDKITFKDGVHCTGWRVTTSNKHYYTHIVVQPSFVLTNSEYVKEKVDNKDSIKLQNNVNTKITDYNDKTIFEKEISAIDYARVTYYDSHIDKKVSAVSNNVLGRKYIITWKVNAWEKVTSSNGKAEFLRQDSGKFYDLIPLGGDVDVKSIQVATEGGYLAENEYTYELIPNFKNSGRTMLIVSIDSQAQYYTVYYNTVHSWDSMKDYGRKVLNPVAYETGNEKITNGYPDNGGILSEGNKKLYSDLDEVSNDNKFLYIEQTYNINAITAAVAGLYKKVKNSEESEYSYSTQVEPNEGYSYQLRYQNTYINKATDLILFDSIENFEVVDSEAGTTKTSGWKGTIESINLNQLVLKGIKPVVYVSTQDKLDLSSNNDITDSKVWTEMTDKTDLSQVKAIAIDMRKNLNGNDFILDPGDSITAVIHMKAPENTTKEIEENPYTYNNVYIKDKLIDELDGTEEYFIHQDYTQVKYHVVADVPVVKVNKNDESEKIKDITFRLYGTSNYGTKVDEYVTSTKDGIVYFKGIEAGNYILQEYEATNDWLEDHTEHNVEITNEKNVYVDGKLVSKIAPAKITNLPRIHTDVKIIKKNSINKWLIEGAKFKLSGTSNYGNEILMYATSKSDGTVLFENLEYGTYDLVEVEASEGYILDNNKYRVIVDENGNYDVLKVTENTEVRYAHTSNFNDDGTKINGTYENDEYRKVTIDGAKKLHVYIRYGHVAGWVAIYNGDVVPTIENYDQSISGKLEGYSNTATLYYEREYDIPGDIAQIYFNYAGVLGGPYGYYAQITATNEETSSIYDKGNYIIYNEPLHSFRIVKKDSYTDTEIIGAKFKLTGVSDYGTSYNMEVESKLAGLAEFSELEPGTYLLQETYVPELKDNEGNVISYMLDDTKYLVSIDATGKIIIEGLEKNENGNFVFYNQRNKGQITITKKWIDNSNNDERPEPVIHISTEHPMESKGISFRSNYDEQNGPLYYLDSNYKNKITGTFGRNTDKTEEEVKALGAVRLDENYDDLNSEYKIYGWIDDEGNCWWWSNAEVALLKDDSNYLFYALENVKQIDTSDINTSNVTDMNHMFSDCKKLERLNISNLNTSNVTDMSYMFNSCELTELDVSNFDTSNVTNMSYMFAGCSNGTLEDIGKTKYNLELDLSNFNTSNVTDMSWMFSANNFLELDLSSFDTSNVTDMSDMFIGCIQMVNCNISSFNTSNVTNMYEMFSNCNGFEKLDLSNFDTSKVTNMSKMFYYCTGVKELNISSFNTSNVTDMYLMFCRCGDLTELDVSNFNTSNVTDMRGMFHSCYNLAKLDIRNFDTSKVTDMSMMFFECEDIAELNLSNFDTSKVTDMSGMFDMCRNLKEVNLLFFNTSNVTDMSDMFSSCDELTLLNLSSFDTSKVIDSRRMFSGCDNLSTIYASKKFDLNNECNANEMFLDCTKLPFYYFHYEEHQGAHIGRYFTEVPSIPFEDNYDSNNGPLYYVDSDYKNKITGTFARNLDKNEAEVVALGAVRIDGFHFESDFKIYAWIDDDGNCWWWSNAKDVTMTDKSNKMFSYLANVNKIDLSGINTNSMTNMSSMFDSCSNLTTLNLGELDTSNVKYMDSMFRGCSKLSNIDVGSFNTEKVMKMSYMFYNCSNLTDLNLSNFNTSIVTDMSSMFDSCSNLTTLNLGELDTSNVTNMDSMFSCCSKLSNIDVSSFNTEKVKKMRCMFYNCSNLTDLNLSNFNTSIVTDMSYMFNNCKNLTLLNLCKFNTKKVTNMSSMFYNCSLLTTIYVSDDFITNNVTSSSSMFTGNSKLIGGNGTAFTTSYVTKTYARIDKEGQKGYFTKGPMVYFRGNYNESNGPLYYVDSNYKNKITGTFERDTDKTEKEVKALGAVRIDIDYDNENAEYKIYAWIDDDGNCYWWSNGNEAVMNNDSNRMFYDLANVNTLDLTGINTDSVTNMSNMFYGCSNITELDLNNLNTRNVTDMTRMFYNCKNLTTIYASTNFDTSNVNLDTEMFGECSKLKGKNGTIYNNSHIDKTYARVDRKDKPGYFTAVEYAYFRDNFNSSTGPLYYVDSDYKNKITGTFERNTDKTEEEVKALGAVRIDKDYNNADAEYKIYAWISNGNCYWWSNADEACITDNSNRIFYYLTKVTKIDLTGMNTTNLINMSSLFDSCNSATEINLGNIDTSNVNNMNSLFSCCYKLTNIDLSCLNTEYVTNMRCMFYNCNVVKELDLSNYDTGSVTNMEYMFYNCKELTTIYASDKFVTTNVTVHGNMFGNCNKLKGGKGTIYNSGYIDKTYARIDIIANPGYFTKKVPQVSLNNFNKISEVAYNDESVVIYEDNLNEKIKLFGSSTVEPSGKVTYSTSDINYDDAGNEIHWKKAGDTWTYTFYVDDPNATWYVWEQSMNGYNSNYTFTEPGIVEDKKATIINNKTEEKGKKYTAIETGNLKISKSSIVQIAKNNEGTGDIYTTLSRDEDNTEFTFKVVLSADENMKNLISGKKIFGDYVFNDGVCFIKLHSGESALIEGIPEGIKYSVTEEFMKEYSPSYTISNYNNYIIKKDSTCEVSVLNYKDVRFEDKVENTSFTLKKEVVGNYEIEEDYKFEIVLNNLIPNEEYYLSNGDTFVSDSTGSANVNVTLKNGETVTVQNIPVGSKYNVYEYEGDYISSYRITDTNNMGLINNTACSNTKTNTPLATNTETADEGENVTITFTNEKTVTQNLKLKKVVTDENDLDSYIFNIEFSNMKPESSFNSTVGKVLSDSNGKAELTVYLAGGEIAEFYNIPVGTNYKVTELASGSIASYTIQDDNGTNKIVRSSGANTVSRQALSTENETVNQGEEVTVTFVNDVINQEVDSVTTSLDIVKDVIKPNGESFADCDDTFMFEIKTDNENNPMPDETTISIKGNGIVGFGEITFTDTGTYTYEVKEKAGDLDCYNYDDTIYTIIYEVTNTDGLLEITKYVKKNGFDSDIIKFTNKVIKFDTIINKIDEDGNYLNGAKLQIIDSSEKVVKEWVTDEGSYNTKLLPGKYILHEVSAPNGYDLSEDVIFNVSEDGIITDSNGEVIEKVIMEDKKAKEIVEPEEEEDNEPEPEPEEKGDEKTIPEEKGDDKPTPQEKNDDKKSEEKNENNNNTNPEDNKTEEKNNSENNIEKENEQVSSVQTGDNLHVYLRILIIAILILIATYKVEIRKNK